MGGAVFLGQNDGANDFYGYEGEEEVGVFVLEQCGTSGSNAEICADARR